MRIVHARAYSVHGQTEILDPVLQAVTGFMDQEQPARERSTARAAFQLYTPAVTASWRLRLLRKGNLPDAELAKIR